MSNNFFISKSLPFKRCGKNVLEPDRPQITIRRLRFACWTTKTTDTHREYIFMARPRQQGLCERASILHLYVLCLSCLLLDPTLRLVNVSIFYSTCHAESQWYESIKAG